MSKKEVAKALAEEGNEFMGKFGLTTDWWWKLLYCIKSLSFPCM